MMSIQGQTLEVTVAGCIKLKETKWVSKQKPYVSIVYGGSKFLTSIYTDGGPNPIFQEMFPIILVEGLRELKVEVWSSNTTTHDHLIGSGRVQLQKVLSEGFEDGAWSIKSKSDRYTGEVRLIMHYSNANNGGASPAPQYYAAPHPPQPQQVPLYYAPPPAAAPPQPYMYPTPYPPQASYPPQPYPHHCYPPNPHQAYPPQN